MPVKQSDIESDKGKLYIPAAVAEFFLDQEIYNFRSQAGFTSQKRCCLQEREEGFSWGLCGFTFTISGISSMVVLCVKTPRPAD